MRKRSEKLKLEVAKETSRPTLLQRDQIDLSQSRKSTFRRKKRIPRPLAGRYQ